MRVIEPRVEGAMLPRKKRRRPSRLLRGLALFGALLIVTYVLIIAIRVVRPLPTVKAETKVISFPAKSVSVFLPGYGQVAVSAAGYGELVRAGDDTPRPIASVSKIITALTILDKKPLKDGELGETLVLNESDIALYEEYIRKDGAVVAVQNGEHISQYQALQAMLLLSANNMADSLAIWAFGSLDNYVAAANSYLTNQGLAKTKVADASGFSPETVSTAREVVKLGEIAMRNSVLAAIVGQRTATVPVAGEIQNINSLLGQNGIDGIKTGNTDQAGGCFLGSAKLVLDDKTSIRVFVAVIGAPKRSTALEDATRVVQSLGQNFEKLTVPAGTTAGYYNPQWSDRIAATSEADISVYRWKSQAVRATTKLDDVPVGTGQSSSVGTMLLAAGSQEKSSPVKLSAPLQGPSLSWRVQEAIGW